MQGETPALPQIPGFTVLGQAGKGGMGSVFIAEQHAPRRKVALKVLARAPDATTLEAFRREAAAIARLEHPRIVPLYSYGEHAGSPYLVMRYLGGGTVADRIRRGAVDLASAERWLQAMAEALDFAHQQGVIHRDVKPSNILLDEQSSAYLSDFGIAGTLADARSGVPTGSAAYMSPEQGRGEAVDRRADIYALAVTLFECLTGKKPYTAETALGVIVRHMHDPIPSAHDLAPAVPAAVAEALRWGMAKNPAERPRTTGDFARLVRQAIEHPEAPVRPSVPGVGAAGEAAPAPRAAPRRRWALIAGLGVLGLAGVALVAGGALAALFLPGSGTQARPTATLPQGLATAVPTPIGQLLADDFTDPTSGFAVLSDEDGGVAYAEGGLQFTALTEGVRWYSPSGRIEAQDVVIEATTLVVSGPPLGEIGVLCRFRDLEHFIALGLRGDGQAAIWQVENGATNYLQEWTPVSGLQLQPGAALQLRAECRAGDLRLEADGRLLVQALDPQPAAGDIVLMAGLAESGELVVVFDEVVVSR
ncbi:MAG TPA: serine/threonine-protein kinase [Anaerolineales bacterium]